MLQKVNISSHTGTCFNTLRVMGSSRRQKHPYSMTPPLGTTQGSQAALGRLIRTRALSAVQQPLSRVESHRQLGFFKPLPGLHRYAPIPCAL